MQANEQTRAAVWGTVDALADAYARQDLETLMSCFVPSPDVFLYGTGADERRMGADEIREQVTRDWQQTDNITMHFESPLVSARGEVAWLAVDGKFEISAGGQAMTIPVRVTSVLEHVDEDWKIAQAHFSAPMAGQDEGQSF